MCVYIYFRNIFNTALYIYTCMLVFNNWKYDMYHGMNIIKLFRKIINYIFVNFPISCLKLLVTRTRVLHWL